MSPGLATKKHEERMADAVEWLADPKNSREFTILRAVIELGRHDAIHVKELAKVLPSFSGDRLEKGIRQLETHALVYRIYANGRDDAEDTRLVASTLGKDVARSATMRHAVKPREVK